MTSCIQTDVTLVLTVSAVWIWCKDKTFLTMVHFPGRVHSSLLKQILYRSDMVYRLEPGGLPANTRLPLVLRLEPREKVHNFILKVFLQVAQDNVARVERTQRHHFPNSKSLSATNWKLICRLVPSATRASGFQNKSRCKMLSAEWLKWNLRRLFLHTVTFLQLPEHRPSQRDESSLLYNTPWSKRGNITIF